MITSDYANIMALAAICGKYVAWTNRLAIPQRRDDFLVVFSPAFDSNLPAAYPQMASALGSAGMVKSC